MTSDTRDPLEVLKAELDFIEKGGYGRSPRTPQRSRSSFEDSLTCINYADPDKVHPCEECQLIDWVPTKERERDVPCHFIPLNESGDTVERFEAEDNQHKLEEALKQWLRAKIKELETGKHSSQESS